MPLPAPRVLPSVRAGRTTSTPTTAGWQDAEDIELYAQDAADDYAGDIAYGDTSDPQPDTPSLDVEGFRFQAGF